LRLIGEGTRAGLSFHLAEQPSPFTKGIPMNEQAPTKYSTRPLGNTSIKPSVLEYGIGANVAAKMKQVNPDATRALRDMLDRKQQQGGGHACD
jgi:hypothetical protein